MRFLRFTIKNYRAIVGPLVIDVSKGIPLPIIGINECGKTTVLYAIFAFDEMNDDWKDGKHLYSPNLYSTAAKNPAAIIEAEIEIKPEDLIGAIEKVKKNAHISPEEKRGITRVKSEAKKFDETIIIQRNLETKEYKALNSIFKNNEKLSGHIAHEVVRRAPYILYFDDFMDVIDNKIEIKKEDDDKLSPWLSILERLFQRADKSYSVFGLSEMSEKHRNGVLSDVEKCLQETLADEWSRFSLEEDTPILKLVINYSQDKTAEETTEYLSIRVKESIGGKERFFDIEDRSKGFFWFFNFVMKLEFNPKTREVDDKDTIYLLDEPGSYLHSNAQNKLCEKLSKLSQNNVVIYCTHSYYLLNPKFVSINSVRVVEKDKKSKSILMNPVAEASGRIKEKIGAFQPLLEALEVKPLIFDYKGENVVLTEGIYDYYVFELFKNKTWKKAKELGFFPCVNAHSISNNISFMIFGRIKYIALWDNDEEGRKEFNRAKKYFGEEEAKRFLILPSLRTRKTYKLENLFAGNDLKKIKKSLSIPANSCFEKTILKLYFESLEKKKQILDNISETTNKRINFVFEKIIERLEL